MPTATEIQIADAVVAELNDPVRTWAGTFAASRKWMTIYSPADLTNLKCKVVATRILEENRISRSDPNARESFKYEVAIDFQVMFPAIDDAGNIDNSLCDAQANIAEAVHDFFRDGHRLATMTSALVWQALRETLFDEELLYSQRTWETTIMLTVFITR